MSCELGSSLSLPGAFVSKPSKRMGMRGSRDRTENFQVKEAELTLLDARETFRANNVP